jgi:hypothetical protein
MSALPDVDVLDEAGHGLGIPRTVALTVLQLLEEEKLRRAEHKALKEHFSEDLKSYSARIKVGEGINVPIPEGIVFKDGFYTYRGNFNNISGITETRTFKLFISKGKARIVREK